MDGHQVGINRRIFDSGYAHDDINHTQYYGATRKNFLVQDSIPFPVSMFEERITNGEQRYFRPSEVAYEMKQANSLGKKPKYIQDRLDELKPIGVYEQVISNFPYNIGLMKQAQFEVGQGTEITVPVVIDGKRYLVKRGGMLASLATSGNIDPSVFIGSELKPE